MAKYKIDLTLEKEVKEYMKDVLNKLKLDGKIDESWNAGLYLIAQNYNTVVQCDKQISTDGLTIKDRFGSVNAHPLIKIKNDASIQLQKLLIEFLLTKKSSMKNNQIENIDDEISPLMTFVNQSKKVEKRVN